MLIASAMRDLSLGPMDNHLNLNANESRIRPEEELWRRGDSSTTGPDAAEFSTTAAFALLESVASTLVAATELYARNLSDNASSAYAENGLSSKAANTVWDSCDTENPYFNCTVLEFLEYYQGPQMMPFFKAIMVSGRRVNEIDRGFN